MPNAYDNETERSSPFPSPDSHFRVQAYNSHQFKQALIRRLTSSLATNFFWQPPHTDSDSSNSTTADGNAARLEGSLHRTMTVATSHSDARNTVVGRALRPGHGESHELLHQEEHLKELATARTGTERPKVIVRDIPARKPGCYVKYRSCRKQTPLSKK